MAVSARRPRQLVDGNAVAATAVSAGHICGEWRDLGRAAGSRTVGVRRIAVAPDSFSTPVHTHGAEEEIFFVLGGAGLLWQGGKTYEVGVDDTIVHRPLSAAHTLRAGPDGLDVLAFGRRRDPSMAQLPRAGIAWVWPSWVEIGVGEHPFAREAALGPPECPPPLTPRADNIVALADAPALLGGALRRPARAAGARDSGLSHIVLDPHASGAPAHCHSLEEEIFIVLAGAGTLVLHETVGEDPAEYPLRAGDVVSRPAATGIAHAFRSGDDGMTLLAYGSREGNDMVYYPGTGSVALRGLGVSFRPEGLVELPRDG